MTSEFNSSIYEVFTIQQSYCDRAAIGMNGSSNHSRSIDSLKVIPNFVGAVIYVHIGSQI